MHSLLLHVEETVPFNKLFLLLNSSPSMEGKKEGLAIWVARQPSIDCLKKNKKKIFLVIYLNGKVFCWELQESISFKLK